MAEGTWDKEGNEYVERILQLVLPSLNKGLEEAFKKLISMAKYFMSYNDLSRMVLLTFEEKMRLPESVKEKLLKELENIYRKTQAQSLPLNILQRVKTPDFFDFRIADERSINYALKLHDFYLGKFFQGDTQLRLRCVNWMSKYYLEKGNPIGRGQEGIKEFLNEFGAYIKPQTEWRARQIIDTSVNYLRNSARLRAFQKARVKYYRWDAVGDRLTCRICRSLDGRIFRTEDAIPILDMIENSEDPTIIRDLKPILKEPWKGTTASLPNKWPPSHPHCRCRIVAYEEEIELPVTVERPPFAKDTPAQRELEEFYKNLSPAEISQRIKAHLGSDWLRPERGVKTYKKSKRELLEHFKKHAHEFGYSTLEEYRLGVYNVIRNPDKVYVEKSEGETFFLFLKGDQYVVSNDDILRIVTYFKPENFERYLRSRPKDGILRIV